VLGLVWMGCLHGAAWRASVGDPALWALLGLAVALVAGLRITRVLTRRGLFVVVVIGTLAVFSLARADTSGGAEPAPLETGL
ncbi:hypothetical protein, partial [Enterococcus faecium]|uniref:hypothetical protein n=1 Tax=Enterococcus faecium TaxID=1352 RepID=UPI003F4367F6